MRSIASWLPIASPVVIGLMGVYWMIFSPAHQSLGVLLVVMTLYYLSLLERMFVPRENKGAWWK